MMIGIDPSIVAPDVNLDSFHYHDEDDHDVTDDSCKCSGGDDF